MIIITVTTRLQLTRNAIGVLAQVFTSVEGFSTAKAALEAQGLKVNHEESELVFKAAAPVEVGGWGHHLTPAHLHTSQLHTSQLHNCTPEARTRTGSVHAHTF